MSAFESDTDDGLDDGDKRPDTPVTPEESHAQDENAEFDRSFIASPGNSQVSHISAERISYANSHEQSSARLLFSPSSEGGTQSQQRPLLGKAMQTPVNLRDVPLPGEGSPEVLPLFCLANFFLTNFLPNSAG